jgi:hypothetical protein
MEQHQIEFHVAEYTAIRSELSTSIRWTYMLAMYGVIANAFIVTWIASQVEANTHIKFLYMVASWLPAVVTVISGLIIMDNMRAIKRLGDYCVSIEKLMAKTDMGWQQYTRQLTEGKTVRSQHIFTVVYTLQLLLSIAFGLYMTL